MGALGTPLGLSVWSTQKSLCGFICHGRESGDWHILGHPPVLLEESSGSKCVVIERCRGLSKIQVTEVYVWCYYADVCRKNLLEFLSGG